VIYRTIEEYLELCLYRISVTETGTLIGLLKIVGTLLGLVVGGAFMGKFAPSGN